MHPNTKLIYRANDMVMRIHSDALYLLDTNARSREGGLFFLVLNKYNDTAKINGAILTPTVIPKNAMSLAVEAEVSAIFHNAQEAETIRTTLEEMNIPQPSTSIQTDKSTADGISNGTVQRKRSKSMEIRFHWVRDRVQQKHFNIFWKPEAINYSDYMTKHPPYHYHRKMIPVYL